MKTKTKKIFSLSVLVMCIAVLGLVSAVSAVEDPIEDILNITYGVGNWVGPLPLTEISFTQTTMDAVLVYVDDHQAGNTDPTGWYSTATGSMDQLFAAPKKR